MLEWMPWAVAIAIGFITLNQGAKFITDNATRISGKIGRSRFVVGALLVSTLSALPELLVSGIAAEEGSPEIALGNALASTVVTIAFVIGASALVRPIKTSCEIVLRDAVFLAIVTLVAATLLLDGNLTQYEGLALVALFVPYVAAAYHATRRGYTDLVLGVGIGASVVTTLLTLGVIGLLRPSTYSVELLLPVVGAMVLTSFLLLALMIGEWKITSRSGAVLTSSYFAMVAFNLVWFRGGFT